MPDRVNQFFRYQHSSRKEPDAALRPGKFSLRKFRIKGHLPVQRHFIAIRGLDIFDNASDSGWNTETLVEF